ncbi:MAG: energy transducer TonB [Thiobacillus sp.]|uniref:energy transducer TonB n=1 Tax=Thiobacillus sp. TaxID=924 RepID=UPI0028953E7E|nr:energy transducer TonB [Thiobacillus sp.]MDT3705712.1 energy transducer TonB [Thiobacillus sp.]
MNVLRRVSWDRTAGLLLVVALHGVVLYGLWAARVIPPPTAAMTLFVNLIEPAPIPPKPSVTPPPRPAKPLKRETPPPPEPHHHLAANTPVVSPTDAVEPPPPPAVTEAPPEPAPLPPAPPAPPEPVTLGTELALTCPERSPPAYPPLARRLGETGKVVLRVELDETGHVVRAGVLASSGSHRLDAAALAAVRTWRCNPAQRDGQAVRSVATQPFNFTLEGR